MKDSSHSNVFLGSNFKNNLFGFFFIICFYKFTKTTLTFCRMCKKIEDKMNIRN